MWNPYPSLCDLDQPTRQARDAVHRPTQRLLHRSWVVLGLWLTLISIAGLAQAANQTFKATIRNASSGSYVCMAFQHHGQATHPSRFNWGHDAAYCGYSGGKEELINSREAVWTFESLGNDEYIIYSASRGEDECLVFGQNGHAEHPDRFRWSHGPYCGLQGGRDELLANRQAVWKVELLQANLYTIKNASRNGTDECLVFGNHGNDPFPSRYNWGPGDYCGYPGGRYQLLQNKQAVFEINRLTLDEFVIPQAWVDGYLVLQNWMYPNQLLQVGHNGNGQVYVGYGDDDAYRWKAERIPHSNFFYLKNVLHDRQRLHVGHNGNGVLYASDGDDDAYQWTVEPVGPSFRLRNKKYPDQRIRVGDNADFSVRANQGSGENFDWDVVVLPAFNSPVPDADLSKGSYLTSTFRIENRRFSGQRMHAGHNGNGVVYTGSGDDAPYHWHLIAASPGYYFLENAGFPGEAVRVDGAGSGTLMVEPMRNDTAFEWKVEPVGQHFFLTSRRHPDQRIQVSSSGSGHIWAAPGNGDVHQWSLFPIGVTPSWVDRSESCRAPFHAEEVVMRVCFYEDDHQTGRSWCKVLSGSRNSQMAFPIPGDIPEGVGLRARSVEAENCRVDLPPPTVMVYDEPWQRSDTETIVGQGSLGSLAEKVQSFFLLQNETSKDANFVCMYKGDQFTDDKHCRPYEEHEPVLNLSSDFNDQVRSIKAHAGWPCNRVDLWQQYDQGGNTHIVRSDTNLKDESVVISFIPWIVKPWSEAVSSYRLKNLPATSCF